MVMKKNKNNGPLKCTALSHWRVHCKEDLSKHYTAYAYHDFSVKTKAPHYEVTLEMMMGWSSV